MKRLVKRLRNASRKACETRFGLSERAFERCDRRQRPSTPRSFIAHLMRQQLSIAAYADIDASCFRRMLPTVWGETPTRRAISLSDRRAVSTLDRSRITSARRSEAVVRACHFGRVVAVLSQPPKRDAQGPPGRPLRSPATGVEFIPENGGGLGCRQQKGREAGHAGSGGVISESLFLSFNVINECPGSGYRRARGRTSNNMFLSLLSSYPLVAVPHWHHLHRTRLQQRGNAPRVARFYIRPKL